MSSPGGEFALIRRYFAAASAKHLTDHPLTQLVQGIGDDCAVLAPAADTHQVISIDTSIANRHFPADADACDIAYRALNVAVSDLAAMGATPDWFTLALSLGEQDEAWLADFSQGLAEAAREAPIALVGGDTTRIPEGAPLTISVQVAGSVPAGKALLRQGARVGDTVYVTGTLGNAGAGLKLYMAELEDESTARDTLLAAYLRPKPRLALGQSLLGKASACIDISDGLLADLGHILAASSVGAELYIEQLPLSPALSQLLGKDDAQQLALNAGDDYQLCFTSSLPPAQLPADITAIGHITADTGLRLKDADGRLMPLPALGFDHFR